MKTVGFFPAVTDQREQADLLARSTWYLWPWRNQIASIRMWGLPPTAAVKAADCGLDPSIDQQYPDILALLSTNDGDDEVASDSIVKQPVDLLFVWRSPKTPREQTVVDRAETACRKRGGIVKVVDPKTCMNEGSLYLWGCLQALGDEPSRIEECKSKFQALKTRTRHPRVCIYGTGPSLAQLKDHDFSNTDSIVCNSIIANDDLLARTNPVAIVAGDPIFHAGCSQYAADFRTKLRNVLETRDIYFVTVMRDYVQQLAQLPAHLHDKVIAIPFARDDAPFHFNLEESFHIAPEGNVLSLLLFPLAAALYERVTVAGCDGRPLEENKYFWSHDKASQLSKEKMGNIQVVHPAFFVRSYDDHYSEHVASVSRIVEILEEAGKRIDTLTPSYIPALASRQCFETLQLPGAKATRDTLIVSVNPDATDDYGHWIGYDRQLAEQAKRRNADFISLANVKLRRDIREREGHYRAVFEYETWGAGNQKMRDIDFARLIDFETTLDLQIAELAERHPDQDRVYYLYTGSIPHALAMYRLARKHPHEFFVVNTFWTCVMDCLAEDYVGRWSEFLQEAQAMSNLRIFSITKQLKTIFRESARVNLPLMPHPTPTLAAPQQPRSRAGKPFRVLFPGGMTEQKGFPDVPRIITQIRARPLLDDAEVMVRATETEGTIGAERLEIVGQIKINAAFVNEVMDDKAFLNWLSNADVAVLPYRRQEWVYRNSALLVDLLYLGVPIVCARGTWLSDVLDQLGGGIAVDGDDPASYALAIEKIRADRDGYVRKAVEAAIRYDAANSWAVLMDSVLAILQDPASRADPPKHATADEAAPINWWDDTPVTRPHPPVVIPPAPVVVEKGAGAAEAARFAFRHLTRSPAIVAGWSFAIVCVIISRSEWPMFQPISVHLQVIAAAALMAAGALLCARYLQAHKKGVMVRLSLRPALQDLVLGMAEAVRAPGLLRKAVMGLFVVAAMAWAVTYVMRLNGSATQEALDWVFFGGVATVAGIAFVGAGVRGLMFATRRIFSRFSSRIITQARLEDAKIQEKLSGEVLAIREEVSARFDSLRDLAALSNRRLTDVAATQKAIETQAAKLADRSQSLQDALAAHAAQASARIDEVNARTDQLKSEVEAIVAGVDALGENIKTAGGAVDEIAVAVDGAVDEITSAVSGLDEKIRQAVAGLDEKTVQAVDEKIRQVVGARSAFLEGELLETQKRLSSTNAYTEELGTNSSTLFTRVDAALSRLDQVERSASVVRTTVDAMESSGFHVVNRYVPKDQLEHLAAALSKAFDIELTAPLLGYAANQVRQLEANSLGRIAAPMTDILIRIAALQAVKQKEASILEIGTLFGLGALGMHVVGRNRFERIKLTFLDPLAGYYSGDYGPPLIDLWSGVPVTRATLEQNIQLAHVPAEDARILQFYSENPDAIAQAATDHYDVLIIDGDHSYKGVMQDYNGYAPFVRDGGFVIFDDYEVPEWDGVTAAANEILETNLNLQRVFFDGKTLVCRLNNAATQVAPHPLKATKRGAK